MSDGMGFLTILLMLILGTDEAAAAIGAFVMMSIIFIAGVTAIIILILLYNKKDSKGRGKPLWVKNIIAASIGIIVIVVFLLMIFLPDLIG